MSSVNIIGGSGVQLNMEQIERMRAAAAAKAAGITLNSAPVPPVVAPSPEIVPPVRMPPPEAVQAWRSGVNQDIASGVATSPSAAVAAAPAMPLATPRPPARFPTQDVPPVANVPAPTGPAGITLNSAPVAQGWAGTVGLPATPEEAKAFASGQDWAKITSIGDDVAKALRPKAAPDNGAATISPMSVQPNQPSQLSGELMAALLKSKQPRGLTLTGR